MQVFQQIQHLNTIFGKTQKKEKSKTCIWNKRSIFFDLLYWSDLDVRHCIDERCIDVMHMEKNVCDSVIGTLLNIQCKMKDGLITRQDLAEMGIRSQLHPRYDGKKIYLPPACHSLSRGLHVITPSVEDLQQAHLHVLNNSNEVLSYILRLEGLVKESNPKISKNRILKEHNKTFLDWFKDIIFPDDNAFEMLRRLADGPKRNVITWQGYNINKYSFYTKAQDDNNPYVASIPYNAK